MNLLFPHLAEIPRQCACERPRHRQDGSCRTCTGEISTPVNHPELPHDLVWWPFTEAENAA